MRETRPRSPEIEPLEPTDSPKKGSLDRLLARSLPEHRALWAFVGLGLFLRLALYLQNRGAWLDEGSLFNAVRTRDVFDLTTPLGNAQLVPPGFLMLETAVLRVFGPSYLAARSVPMLAALASMVVFGFIGVRWLRGPAAALAVGMFALSDSLIYYASEFKPYGVDLLVATVGLATGLRLLDGPGTSRQSFAFLIGGALAPWFAFATAFVLPSLAAAWFLAAWKRRDRPAMLWATASAIAWGAIQLLVIDRARRLLGPTDFMGPFWAFAFLPIPPRSLVDLQSLGVHGLNLFGDAIWFETVLGPKVSAGLALALATLGAARLARRPGGPLLLVVLLAPMALHAAASALHRYPFHGRLNLYFNPMVLFLVANGAEPLLRRLPRPWPWVVVAILLLNPAWVALQRLESPHSRGFDPHGDLHPDLYPLPRSEETTGLRRGKPLVFASKI